jgi:phospholipid-binding lipoprotein MlaA
MRSAVLLMAVAMLGACSTLQGPQYSVFDPYESSNRLSYKATNQVDTHVLVPVARSYQTVTPGWMGRGVLNLFQNLRTVDSFVNCLLQGKPKGAVTDLTRIVVNSTVGVGGFFDVATNMDLPYQDEDFGQTLAVWGVTRSRYIYLPLMGPTTVRDLPSTLVRGMIPRLLLGTDYHWSMTVVDVVSTRANLLSATRARDASALDPYAFTRDAFYQRRKFQIYDGRPPLDDMFDEFDELDE